MARKSGGEAGQRIRGATLQSIADAAGVHRSTAARALDPQQCHRISPVVVKKVRKEAERQGYRRDAIAASLRTGRSRLVGVVLPDLSNPVFAPILDGIDAELSGHGYSMLVAEGGTDFKQQITIIDELAARRVDGLVLATANRADPAVTSCLNEDVPIVLVNRGEDELRASTTVPDDGFGMKLAVDHLVALGHRAIAHLGGPEGLSTGVRRQHGFETAMTAHGLRSDMTVNATAYGRQAGQMAAADLFDRWPDVTAIAASNDLLSLGLYDEIRERGLSCPQDISVTGFNDMPFVDLVAPPLTTVKVAQTLMGRTAAQLLLKAVERTDARIELRQIPVELIIRGSTATPKLK